MSGVQVGVLQRASGSISNARLLAMVGAPVTLIPAPGVGLMIRPTTIRVWTCVGAGSTGLTRNSAAVSIGFAPAQTNTLIGDGSVVFDVLPAEAQGLWGGAAIAAQTSANTAGYFEVTVVNTTGIVNGQYNTATTAAYNNSIQLAVTTGNFTNTTGATTTLQWEILYYLVAWPQFT